MAFDHHARRRVDGPAEAKADPLDAMSLDEPAAGRFDLLEDALGAAARLDVEPLEGHEPAVPCAHAKLKFGAADFDAEKHGAGSYW